MNIDVGLVVGVFAALVSSVGFWIYIHSIRQTNAQPNIISWLLWLTVAIIATISYFASGARDTIPLPLVYVAGDSAISIVAIRRGKAEWQKMDICYIIGIGVSLLLWRITGLPITTLVVILIIHLMGVLPTCKKAYLKPWSENRWAWIVFDISNLINLFAIKEWRFAIFLLPVYYFLHSTLMVYLIHLSPHRKRNKKQKGGL